MPYFDKTFVKFFEDLSKNNDKEWFHANKKTYENSVKKPFLAFTTDLLAELEKEWGATSFQPKDYIMRINRDIRFSKDKTPYKTHMGLMMSKYGRKEMARPGIFLQINHEGLLLYSGCYELVKDDLINVRRAIMENPKKFEKAIGSAKFKKTYGEILGAKHKRVAPEFRDAAERQPLLFNKGFYYGSNLPVEDVLADNLLKNVLKIYHAAEDINAFLEEALVG